MALFEREMGVLLHPSSLPGRRGIGEIGRGALELLERLSRMGQSLWQVLPLNPVGPGHSPYQARSTFAGDTRLIGLDELHELGLVSRSELDAAECPSPAHLVDFDWVDRVRMPTLRRAAARMIATRTLADELEAFRQRNGEWLPDYALYAALRRAHDGQSWSEWPQPLRDRLPGAMRNARQALLADVQVEEALQFLFERQWAAVHEHARSLGIRIIGDIPIFVALDSADVWAHPELFLLEEGGAPSVVAGVPPDYFSATGQLWGNPLYDWPVHEQSGFTWWLERLGHVLAATDVVRIDHFRGFAQYWEVPATETTAVVGRWVDAPGDALFSAVLRRFGEQPPIIAEDLGIITDDVTALRERFGLPGMKVVQFSFGGKPEDLPDRFPVDSVCYTGTHDNDTTVGWYHGAPELDPNRTKEAVLEERDRVRRFYSTDGTDIHWTCIRDLASSEVGAVVVPLQDWLGQGSDRRMNTPGTTGGLNWAYRVRSGELTEEIVAKARHIAEATHRGAFATRRSLPETSQ